jgi:hypothetical protein
MMKSAGIGSRPSELHKVQVSNFPSIETRGTEFAPVLTGAWAESERGREITLANMDGAVVKQAQRINPKKREPLTSPRRPSVGMKRLTLDLREPLHRAIKKNAAEEGVTMAQKLRALLSEHYRFTEGRDLSSPRGSTAAEI